MFSMRISALFLCAVTSSILFLLEGKPLEESHEENAVDKIIKANGQYADLRDSRHEVDMVLRKIKTSRKRRSVAQTSSGGPAQIYTLQTVQLWPRGVIPYTIAHDLRGKPKYYDLIQEAIKEYQHKTCLRFIERTTEANYLEFYYGIGCKTDAGYKGRGIQLLSLGKGCDSLDIVIHEMGHAIGFHHEQNRPDRNKHIKVLWDNIRGQYHIEYRIKSGWHPESLKIPYDYYSIMHYGNQDFRKNSRVVTMESLIPGITSFGNNRLSALDVQRVTKMYKCPEFPDFPRGFYWSHDGRGIQGQTCTKMDEPRDPYSWNDNYLCYRGQGKRPLNITWSHSGPIYGMSCTKITDASKPSWTSWDDNYLCVPTYSPYKFKWVTTRPSAQDRKNCKKINEPRDRYWGRGYHYLCATDRETDKRDGQWSEWGAWGTCTSDCGTGHHMRIRNCTNPPPANSGKSCVGAESELGTCNTQPCAGPPRFPEDFSYSFNSVSLPSGYCHHTYNKVNFYDWIHYYFCTSKSRSDPGITWSYSGPLPGKRCTRIYNPIENKYRRGSWMNNYLCVPTNSSYHFVWSLKGPIKGLSCIKWYAMNGRNGWDKTYLCHQKNFTSVPTITNNLIKPVPTTLLKQ